MPIGQFKNFAALKGALLKKADHHISNPGAYTAAVARKMEPNFDKEAAETRHENALQRAAKARVSSRRG